MAYEDQVAVSRAVLTRYFKRPIPLHFQEIIVDEAACDIIRCALIEPPPGAPSTVVVKISNEAEPHLHHEWGGLAFVNQVGALDGLFPRLYGGDATADLLVMSDLGSAKRQLLGHILWADDAQYAEAALVAFQQAVGRLHASTRGQEGVYQQCQQRHSRGYVSRHRIHRLPDLLMEMVQVPAQLGLRPISGVLPEIETIALALHDPGPFYAFTHGDTTPANFFYTPDRVCLYDLEACAFRHALLDGVYAPIRYLHSVWAQQIPPGVQRRMAAAYRTALVAGCPEAAEDALFYPAWVACCAAWLGAFCHLIPSVLEEDKRWGDATMRQRIMAALPQFVQVVAETGLLPAIGETAVRLDHHLRQRWPAADCVLPVYRAWVEREASDVSG